MKKHYKLILFITIHFFCVICIIGSDITMNDLIDPNIVTTGDYQIFFQDREKLSRDQYDRSMQDFIKIEENKSFLDSIYSKDDFKTLDTMYRNISNKFLALEQTTQEIGWYLISDKDMSEINNQRFKGNLINLNEVRFQAESHIMQDAFLYICKNFFSRGMLRYQYQLDYKAFLCETNNYTDRLQKIFSNLLEHVKKTSLDTEDSLNAKDHYLVNQKWQFFERYMNLIYDNCDNNPQKEKFFLKDRKNIRLFFNNQFFSYANLAKKIYQQCKPCKEGNELNITDDLRNEIQQYFKTVLQVLDQEITDKKVKEAFDLIGDEAEPDYSSGSRERIVDSIKKNEKGEPKLEQLILNDLLHDNNNFSVTIGNDGMIRRSDGKKVETPKKKKVKKRSYDEVKESDTENENVLNGHLEKKQRKKPKTKKDNTHSEIEAIVPERIQPKRAAKKS